MPVVDDELWKHPGNPGMIVVTSHASLSSDGSLYLNSPLEVEAARRIPSIERQCGRMIQSESDGGVYGFLPVRPSRPEQRVVGFGLFQTRIHWDEAADPRIIKHSMDCLRQFVAEHGEVRIRMNFPGIGDGGLPVEEVSSLLLPIPSTVTVCHQGEIARSSPDSFPGFKTLYIEVENMLRDGRFQLAVDYLMRHGFDIQSAEEQVRAVERLLREGSNGRSEASWASRVRTSEETGRRVMR